jgi:hypothetical protein
MSKPVPMSPELQRLLGRTMIDPTFRAELLRDPAGVLRAAQLGLSDDDLARLALQLEQRGGDLRLESDARELNAFW